MNLLLHTCCAPCSVMCIETLTADGVDHDLFWYNPNIHPVTEYRARRDCLVDYAKTLEKKLHLLDEYGLRQFVAAVSPDFDARCAYCYDVRLSAAARFAAQNGYDGFSTTLLISPYQNHDALRETGERSAKTFGTTFVYRDFRPYFREGQQKAREMGFYMQKYCGCVFSEEERYLKKKK